MAKPAPAVILLISAIAKDDFDSFVETTKIVEVSEAQDQEIYDRFGLSSPAEWAAKLVQDYLLAYEAAAIKAGKIPNPSATSIDDERGYPGIESLGVPETDNKIRQSKKTLRHAEHYANPDPDCALCWPDNALIEVSGEPLPEFSDSREEPEGPQTTGEPS